jgi:hypothetical protein
MWPTVRARTPEGAVETLQCAGCGRTIWQGRAWMEYAMVLLVYEDGTAHAVPCCRPCRNTVTPGQATQWLGMNPAPTWPGRGAIVRIDRGVR